VKRFAIAWLLVAACGPAAAIDAKDGKGVFAAYCATCHGPYGKPPAAMAAKLAVRDLTSAELRQRVSARLVEGQVRKGSDNKLMPSFEGVIGDAQIKAVAEWVASPEFLMEQPQ
jgi:mono/diheme cytochrome c family protein